MTLMTSKPHTLMQMNEISTAQLTINFTVGVQKVKLSSNLLKSIRSPNLIFHSSMIIRQYGIVEKVEVNVNTTEIHGINDIANDNDKIRICFKVN